MKQTTYLIGVMSGTSLDGIDLAYIALDDQYQFQIIKAETVPYTTEWTSKLVGAFKASAEEITALDADYGAFLGHTIQDFIQRHQIEQLDIIASHGHTIFHNPEANYTLQIGNGPEIHTITKIKTICNFRVQDIALGGQGAPLVPIGDQLLFAQYTYCLNLGGFANISTQQQQQRIAYDICPTNIVLNHYTKLINKPYDEGGQLARSGTIHQPLLDALNQIDFYRSTAPKSLGYEFVVDEILPMINGYELSIPDILCTFIEHIAIQITQKIVSDPSATVLITGGGAYNKFLLERLQQHTKTQLIVPSDDLINYKEALIFALLGYLKQHRIHNCLSSVTGASQDHSSGIVYDSLTS